MALTDDMKKFLKAGVKPHEIRQALRQAEDEEQLLEHSAELPNIPALSPAVWNKLKARLLIPGGPTNKYEMLKRLHNALDADDQLALWRALFGLVKAVWSEHPGHRRDIPGSSV